MYGMYVLPSWRDNSSFIPPLSFCVCQALAWRNVSISTGLLGTLVYRHSSTISFANSPEAFLLGLPGAQWVSCTPQGPLQSTIHFRTVLQSFPFNSSGARIRLCFFSFGTCLFANFSTIVLFVSGLSKALSSVCWLSSSREQENVLDGITRAFHLSLLWKGSVES